MSEYKPNLDNPIPLILLIPTSQSKSGVLKKYTQRYNKQYQIKIIFFLAVLKRMVVQKKM